MKTIYWRIEQVNTDGLIDTSGALQVGFLNGGDAKVTVNGLILPKVTLTVGLPPENYVQNVLFFPQNDNERDGTGYRVIFDKTAKAKRLFVFIKMVKKNDTKETDFN